MRHARCRRAPRPGRSRRSPCPSSPVAAAPERQRGFERERRAGRPGWRRDRARPRSRPRPEPGRLEDGAAALRLPRPRAPRSGGRRGMTDGGGLPVVVGQGGEVIVEIGRVDGLDRVGDAAVRRRRRMAGRSAASVSATRACANRTWSPAGPASSTRPMRNGGSSASSAASALMPHASASTSMPTAAPATAATLSTVRESSGSRSTRLRTTSRTLAGTVAAAMASCGWRPCSAARSRTSSVRKNGLPAVRPCRASAAAGSRSRSPTSRAKDRTCSGPSPVSSKRTRSPRRASDPRVDGDGRRAGLVRAERRDDGHRPGRAARWRGSRGGAASRRRPSGCPPAR